MGKIAEEKVRSEEMPPCSMERAFSRKSPIFKCHAIVNPNVKVGPGGYWTKCYYINKKLRKMNQTDARKFCEEMGGNLLTMREKHEKEFIHENMDHLRIMDSIWLGVDRMEPLNGDP